MSMTKLPSKHQIGDAVLVEFGTTERLRGKVNAVTFTHSLIFYDLTLFIDESSSINIQFIPEAYVYADNCKREETSEETIHWLIHEAAHELSCGNVERAQELLSKADNISHSVIEKMNLQV